MPLLLVTGYPSSGKSKLSQEISAFVEEKLRSDGDTRDVRVVSDSDSLDWDGRDLIYMNIAKEKELRSWLRAEVQRYVNLGKFVILDAASYIKGYRYELYCLAKEAKTQYCIVEKLIDPELCWSWNVKLKEQKEEQQDESLLGYNRETFDALMMRYEKCDENNRWDSPLFKLNSEKDELNLDELYKILVKDEPLAPNKCTSLSSTNTTIYKAN